MRVFSYVFTSVTLAASIATLWPLLMEADAAMSRQWAGGPLGSGLYLQPYTPDRVVPFPSSSASSTVSASRCSLLSTDVAAQVSGYTARVTVRQVFHNPNTHKFDAVYSFPLSDSAAVDDMTMRIGGRTIKGSVKQKAEARAVYAAAQAQGRTATLLEQQRTNVFTQSVANVEPGQTVEVTLKYTDILTYSNGKYEFVFPTKVGPRFVPAGSAAVVPEADGSTVYGGRLSFDVDIDGGMPISHVTGNVAADRLWQPSVSSAHFVRRDVGAGDDFKLSWEAAADRIESGILTQRTGMDGYLTLMLMPPKRVAPADISPKEFVFLIDCSGSQAGAPLQKAKDTLHYIVDHMGAYDTFQIVAFSNGSETFAPEPVRVNEQMKRNAHAWIDRLDANGGTMMAPAVERVCAMPAPENRLRIVSFMTDGFISNDREVINLVKRLRGNSRWFPFGTGNGVNRMLIDGIAKAGGGEPEYVDLGRDGKEVGKEFFERISSPVLTNVKVRFEGITVDDVYPNVLSDVWAHKPLYFHARYHGWGRGTAVVTGFAGGRPYEARLPISLPLADGGSEAVGQTWARAKIEELTSADEITTVALQHHLMSQYTSFVAVDDADKSATYNDPSAPRTVRTETCYVSPGTCPTIISSPSASWNPLQRALDGSFNTVVTQLNALNCYSASTSMPQQKAADAAVSDVSNSLIRIVSLIVMWIASLWLLFRRAKTKA